jgi:hypothetical protein
MMAKQLTNAIVVFIGVCLVVALGAYFKHMFKVDVKKKDNGV